MGKKKIKKKFTEKIGKKWKKGMKVGKKNKIRKRTKIREKQNK